MSSPEELIIKTLAGISKDRERKSLSRLKVEQRHLSASPLSEDRTEAKDLMNQIKELEI